MLRSSLLLSVFFTLQIIFNASTVQGQTDDTLRVLNFDRNSDTLEYVKEMESVQLYNPIFVSKNFYANTGNIGLASRPLFFDEKSYRGFQLYRNNFAVFEYAESDINYFQVKKPLTNVFFMLGPKKQNQQFQFGEVVHTQNVNKNWNVGIKIRKVVSSGVFSRQQTNLTNTALFSSFRSGNHKYELFFQFLYNKSIVNENGGISNSILLGSSGRIERTSVPIYLKNAKNWMTNGTILLTQHFNFGSTYNDSKDSANPVKTIASARIYHRMRLKLSEWYYKDVDSSTFYKSFLLTGSESSDKLAFKEVANEIGFEQTAKKSDFSTRNLLFNAGIQHSYYYCRQRDLFNFYNNLRISSGLAYITNAKADGMQRSGSSKKADLQANYFIAGYNANNFDISTNYYLPFSAASLKFSASYQQSSPDYLSNYFSANHFKWINNFKNLNIAKAAVDLQSNKFVNLEAALSQISNYVYYNDTAYATQSLTAINLASIWFNKNLAYKKFHFNSYIQFQKVVSGVDLLRLPLLNNKHSMYLQGFLFHRNLLYQLGFDLFYNTSYASLAYMPATTQFYMQNSSTTGNYLLADLFLNAQIKTVFITIKLEHANKGLLAGDYYMVPNFPMPDRLLKFGINWQFQD